MHSLITARNFESFLSNNPTNEVSMSNQVVKLSGSYVQDQRHTNVSNRFNVIQPSAVGDAMARHGLQLASLSTGKARHVDKLDFQRTLSRYRGAEIMPGIHIDIIHSGYHMGRGVDSFSVGFYRIVCTNGLQTGTSFDRFEVRHSGDTFLNLDNAIAACLESKERLTATIERMKSTVLTPEQHVEFGAQVARLLTPSNALRVKHRLLTPKRDDDKGFSLFEVLNVAQESGMQGKNVVYELPTDKFDSSGQAKVRTMTARAIKPNSAKDEEFNGAIFDLALKFAA